MQAPEVLDRLQDEADRIDPMNVRSLEYTRMVFDETLRFRPPVPVNGRVAEPTRLGPHGVADGATALLIVTNIHRHPDHWERPDVFDPDHFTPGSQGWAASLRLLPFGAGPHMWIGSNFAMIEGVILLEMSAREFTFRPAIELPRHQATAVTMKPKGGLPVHVSRR
jgi:cytochrome P450